MNYTSLSLSSPSESSAFPRHVGIIMDGNARWAKKNHTKQTEGHKQGMYAMCAIIEEACRLGLEYLTLYCFSIENQQRPQEEVSHLMELGLIFMREKASLFHDHEICFRVIGNRQGLPSYIVQSIEILEEQTQHFHKLHVTCAVNYGGRQEIFQAIEAIVRAHFISHEADSFKKEDIEQFFIHALETNFLPEVDLIIRTGGEKRLSNFLLWQAAYSEFEFTPVLWPDFTPLLFRDILMNYALRERRFGQRPVEGV